MSFQTIKGQDRQIGTLVNALKEETLAHAYLFTGIPGSGKTTTAFTLAKALHCKDKRDDSCDVCISCKKIAKKRSRLSLVILVKEVPDGFILRYFLKRGTTELPLLRYALPGDYLTIDREIGSAEQISFGLHDGRQWPYPPLKVTNGTDKGRDRVELDVGSCF